MASWAISLIITGFIVWTGILVYWRYEKTKRNSVILSIAALMVMIIPAVTLWQLDVSNANNQKAEERWLIESFEAKYGDDYAIIRASKTDVYVVMRAIIDADGNVDLTAGTKQSLLIGNSWLEIGIEEKE